MLGASQKHRAMRKTAERRFFYLCRRRCELARDRRWCKKKRRRGPSCTWY